MDISMRQPVKTCQTYSLLLLLVVVFASSSGASESTLSWAEDLQFYRSEVFQADASYSDQERERAEILLSRLERGHEGMSQARIELALAEISALTNNGHSYLMPGGWTERYAQLPVRFRVFSDGIYVIGSTDEYRRLRGKRLVAIDGQPVNRLRENWARFQGGVDGWRDSYLPYFLETPTMLHAAGLALRADSLGLTLADAEGNLTEEDINASSDLPPLDGIELYIAPSRLLVEAKLAQPDELPLYLQQPRQMFRFSFVDDLDAVYIQFKANTDVTGQENIDVFLDSVSAFLVDRQPDSIILDQRFNYGGDLNITRELMQKMPKLVGNTGKIYIISSGRTFSAGISSMGYLKQAAGEQAIIVGSPVGDSLEFWAEGDLKALPHSGVAFLMATERHNYMTGCPEPDCHGNIRRHPIKVKTLAPDIPAALSWSDYERGVDPAMVAIREHMAATASQPD
jgi:hypothetical protein